MVDHGPASERLEIGEIFDEIMVEVLKHDRIRPSRPPLGEVGPEVAEAVAALREIFEGEHNVTADLSFDQVYEKAQRHFVTILRHLRRDPARRE